MPLLCSKLKENESADAFIALGANLGDARANVVNAIKAIENKENMRLIAQSSLYESKPIDAKGKNYVNAVVHVQTCLSAHGLLKLLQQIERQFGRKRLFFHAPRTLDLDLLIYVKSGVALRMSSHVLTLPHARMFTRAFVLLPLAEIAPQWVSKAQLMGVSQQEIRRL